MKKNVLMCCSDLSVKGGMTSVVKNYLEYKTWDEYKIKYVPTHIEKNKIQVAIYFFFAYIKILFMALFGKIDIAYLHTAERGSFYRKAIIVRTLKFFNVKCVMHHHAAEFDAFYNSLTNKKKMFVIKTLEMVDLNIVLSIRLISMITGKAPNAKVKVLYNAVNTWKDNPYNIKSKGILFLGRLGKRKGVYDLLKVIERIDDKIPEDIVFYLCGDGEVERVREIVCEQKISHRIAHVGWIDKEMQKSILENIMINVLPSYNEGLPMTIIETMAYGIPNISTKIASIPEVIKNGETGFLIEPGDILALEQILINLCENLEMRKKISENSWKLIREKFDLNEHINAVKVFLSEI